MLPTPVLESLSCPHGIIWLTDKIAPEFAMILLGLHSDSAYQHVKSIWLLARPQSQPILREPETSVCCQGWFSPSTLCWGSAERTGIQTGIATVPVKQVSLLYVRKVSYYQGASGFEPETSWSAVKCSTTELYPLLVNSVNKRVIISFICCGKMLVFIVLWFRTNIDLQIRLCLMLCLHLCPS